MFGKKLSDYISFQRGILILIAVVFAARLAMSLAGMPNDQTRWVSVNVVLLIALVYSAIGVHTKGFGRYKQLFGLLLVQNFFAHVLIALAVILGIVTGTDNIFTAPEFSGGEDGKNFVHVVAHLLVWIVPALIAWGIGSLILFVTRKVRA